MANHSSRRTHKRLSLHGIWPGPVYAGILRAGKVTVLASQSRMDLPATERIQTAMSPTASRIHVHERLVFALLVAGSVKLGSQCHVNTPADEAGCERNHLSKALYSISGLHGLLGPFARMCSFQTHKFGCGSHGQLHQLGRKMLSR